MAYDKSTRFGGHNYSVHTGHVKIHGPFRKKCPMCNGYFKEGSEEEHKHVWKKAPKRTRGPLRTPTKHNNTAWQIESQNAKSRKIAKIRRRRFLFHGHEYKFGWNLRVFATVNRLVEKDPATETAFQQICEAARRDMRDITETIWRSKVRINPAHSSRSTYQHKSQ